jgi:hypothetical protein
MLAILHGERKLVHCWWNVSDLTMETSMDVSQQITL